MSFEEFKKYHTANYHDGDSHFDERTYQKSNGGDFDCDFVQTCFDHFEAGAASRQGEIDELQGKLRFSEALRDNQFEHLLEITKQRDVAQKNNRELQNRIDKALEKCYTGIRKQGGDYYLELVEEILKGQNNG